MSVFGSLFHQPGHSNWKWRGHRDVLQKAKRKVHWHLDIAGHSGTAIGTVPYGICRLSHWQLQMDLLDLCHCT